MSFYVSLAIRWLIHTAVFTLSDDRGHGREQYFYRGHYFTPLLEFPLLLTHGGGGRRHVSYIHYSTKSGNTNPNCSSTWLCFRVAAVANIDDCELLNSRYHLNSFGTLVSISGSQSGAWGPPEVLQWSTGRWRAHSFNQWLAPKMLVKSNLAVTFQLQCR